MRQTAIFPYKNEELDEISEVISEQIKSKRLSGEQIAGLSARLDNLMINDKIFLDNEISLATVAEKLNISIHDTSYLINEVTGDNFYNFINKYRVEEAKKLLTSDKSDKLNMLGIAFESGFNSKTTFNTAFKKQVGISPSEYAKQKK
jgi:AraC-like DNA-binding protein